jgi:hypothetical protein
MSSSSNHNRQTEPDNDNGPPVTAESYGAVTMCDEDVWLLRIPPKLAAAIEAAPEGSVLGDLVFTKGGVNAKGQTVKPQFTVHIAEELSEAATATTASSSSTTKAPYANLPLQYSLQSMTKKVPVLHPVVRHPTDGSMQVWGTVSRTANVQVQQNDERYRALLKDRLVASNITTSHFVKPMENTDSVLSRATATAATTTSTTGASTITSTARPSSVALAAGSKPRFGDVIEQFGKRRLEAMEQSSALAGLGGSGIAGTGGNKRVRQFAPNESFRSILFALFAQQEYWSVKDIKAAAVAGGAPHAGTKKGETEIREILKEIADYHRSGDHKNMWELRKEYQQG